VRLSSQLVHNKNEARIIDDPNMRLFADAHSDRDALTAFAGDDPTVKSGLLVFTVRPRLVGMERKDRRR